jgi:hypothetical protein
MLEIGLSALFIRHLIPSRGVPVGTAGSVPLFLINPVVSGSTYLTVTIHLVPVAPFFFSHISSSNSSCSTDLPELSIMALQTPGLRQTV